MGKRILRQSTRLSAGIVPAGEATNEQCSRILQSHDRSSGKPSVAHYRHPRIGFADIADKRPGLPLTGQLTAGEKLTRDYPVYQARPRQRHRCSRKRTCIHWVWFWLMLQLDYFRRIEIAHRVRICGSMRYLQSQVTLPETGSCRSGLTMRTLSDDQQPTPCRLVRLRLDQ